MRGLKAGSEGRLGRRARFFGRLLRAMRQTRAPPADLRLIFPRNTSGGPPARQNQAHLAFPCVILPRRESSHAPKTRPSCRRPRGGGCREPVWQDPGHGDPRASARLAEHLWLPPLPAVLGQPDGHRRETWYRPGACRARLDARIAVQADSRAESATSSPIAPTGQASAQARQPWHLAGSTSSGK